MRRSVNEIEAMLRKAATGAGFAFGAAEDIGRAAAWLAVQGRDPVGETVTAICGGPRKTPAPLSEDGVPVLREAGVASGGPSAVDLLAAGVGSRGVRLTPADAPLLLVGLAGVAAATYGLEIVLEFAGTETARVTAERLDFEGPLPTTADSVRLIARTVGGRVRGASASSGGVAVDDAAWRAAEALAGRTYVAASEASRATGAGAGLQDND